MFVWIAVGVGGAVGALARHGLSGLVNQHWPLLRFPVGTAVVNVLGCCVFGLLAGFVASGRLSTPTLWREFVFVGILGGFTTFSTFGFDTVALLRAGGSWQATLNVAIHLIGGRWWALWRTAAR